MAEKSVKNRDTTSMSNQALERFPWAGGDGWDAVDDPASIVEKREADERWARKERKKIEALIENGELEGDNEAIKRLEFFARRFWMYLPKKSWALETLARLEKERK